MRKTRASRSISSTIASRSASRYRNVRGIVVSSSVSARKAEILNHVQIAGASALISERPVVGGRLEEGGVGLRTLVREAHGVYYLGLDLVLDGLEPRLGITPVGELLPGAKERVLL